MRQPYTTLELLELDTGVEKSQGILGQCHWLISGVTILYSEDQVTIRRYILN